MVSANPGFIGVNWRGRELRRPFYDLGGRSKQVAVPLERRQGGDFVDDPAVPRAPPRMRAEGPLTRMLAHRLARNPG